MECVDLKLPFTEEIYDLDTFELNEEYQRVRRGQSQLEQLNTNDEVVLKKIRKCRKILGMMELEIGERRNIENMFNINDGLEEVIKDYNPYVEDNKQETTIDINVDTTINHNVDSTITHNEISSTDIGNEI